MPFRDVENTTLKNRLGSPKSNTINSGNRDTVNAVRSPDFLDNNIGVLDAVKINLAIGDTVNIAIEECVEVTVVLPVEDGILVTWLLGRCRCREENGDNGHQQTEN